MPFNIGPLELAIVLLIVLIIFGPKRLPGLGRQLGSGMREFKESITGNSRDEGDGAREDRAALAPAPVAPAEPEERGAAGEQAEGHVVPDRRA